MHGSTGSSGHSKVDGSLDGSTAGNADGSELGRENGSHDCSAIGNVDGSKLSKEDGSLDGRHAAALAAQGTAKVTAHLMAGTWQRRWLKAQQR